MTPIRRQLLARPLIYAIDVGLVIRRLLAFGLDYFVIVGYLVVLAAASLGALDSRLRGAYLAAWTTAGTAELMGFLVLTLPVVLYFAILESSVAGATFGKRALALRVRALDGSRLGFGRSLLRSAAKFMPWELAHFTIWHYVYALTAKQSHRRGRASHSCSCTCWWSPF